MNASRSADAVLASEQMFFDDDAASLSDERLQIDAVQMARYREARPRASNIPKDALFSELLPLAGKRVLEYGCGTGENAVHLADCGATVTAFDLSPVSVQKARRRAELLGVSDRITFDVRAAGRTGYPGGAFDIVIGQAILHHLHTELDVVYEEVARALTPGGTACFIEPVANSATLRALRAIVPVPTHATPDERQLRYADFERMRQHGFRSVEYRHFYCLGRLKRLLGAWSDRPLRVVDHYTQRALPLLRPCYGVVLVIARR
jgi:SAM-dependent methyltransferase